MRGLPLLAVVVVFAVAAAACTDPKADVRPPPTPGPQAVVREVLSIRGDSRVERGERIRFAVVGTGTGTHFGASTFLHAPAFDDLRVIAVESSSRILAQGTVSLAAGSGRKDLAIVSGTELAIAQDPFEVLSTPFLELGAPPATSLALAGDAGAIDPAGDVDVYQVVPDDGGAHTLVVRIDLLTGSPADFTPSLELHRTDGSLAASTRTRCAWIAIASRAPVFIRVADPLRLGGPDRRYRVVAEYAVPETCLTTSPPDLVP